MHFLSDETRSIINYDNNKNLNINNNNNNK